MAQKRNDPGSKSPSGAKAKGRIDRSAATGRHMTKKSGKAVQAVVHRRGASRPSAVAPATGESQSDVVRARIHPAVKEEASAILASMGLTVSDAFRLLMMRVVAEKSLPFSPLVPNEETVEAMRSARRGELVTVSGVDGLFSSLDADD